MNSLAKNKFVQVKLNNLKKRKYESLLDLSHQDLKKEKTIIKFLFDNLSKEKQDIVKLEKLSFVSLYHSMIGDKHQQLNKEQQEYFEAKLKFDNCQSAITSLKKDIAYYQDEITAIEDLEKQNISEISKSQSLSHEELQDLKSIEKNTDLRAMKIEIQEAIKNGVIVKADLAAALKLIHSAASWGIGDMFGGGLIVTAIKHNKINQSQEKLEKIKASLSKFQRELQDINTFKYSEFKISINKFDIFTDYFLDGMFFDWLVQSKINNSKDMLQKASVETKVLVTNLYQKLDVINKELEIHKLY